MSESELEPVPMEHGFALLECDNCGRAFKTSLSEDEGLLFDGVRNHGKRYGSDDEHKPGWDYSILERNPENGVDQ